MTLELTRPDTSVEAAPPVVTPVATAHGRGARRRRTLRLLLRRPGFLIALAFAVFVRACEPADFGCDAPAFAKCCA